MEIKQEPFLATTYPPTANVTANASHSKLSPAYSVAKAGKDLPSNHVSFYHPPAHRNESAGNNTPLCRNHESDTPHVAHPNTHSRIGWNQDRLARAQQPVVTKIRNAQPNQCTETGREINSRYVHETSVPPNQIPPPYQYATPRTPMTEARLCIPPSTAYPVQFSEYPNGFWNNAERGFEVPSYVTQVPGMNPTFCFQGNYIWEHPCMLSHQAQRYGPSITPWRPFLRHGYSNLNHRDIHERNGYALIQSAQQANATNLPSQNTKVSRTILQTQTENTGATPPRSQIPTAVRSSQGNALMSVRSQGSKIAKKRRMCSPRVREETEEAYNTHTCHMCDSKCATSAQLNEHISTVHLKIKAHECTEPGCGKAFAHKEALNGHYKFVHLRGRPHNCPHCDAKFSTKNNLSKHIDEVHLEIKAQKCTWPGCEKAFGCKRKLTRHYEGVHRRYRYHECPHCDYKFASIRNVHRHIDAVHLKIRPHVCTWPGCGKTFGYQKTLVTHYKAVHLRERPHGCPNCDYKCASKGDLNTHIEAVHLKIKAHKCTWPGCGKAFGHKGALRTHVTGIHRRKRPHKCPYCDYKSAQKGHLTNHIDLIHLGFKAHK